MTRTLLKNILNNLKAFPSKGWRIIALAFFFTLGGCSGDTKYREDTTETLKTNIHKTEKDTALAHEELPLELIKIEANGNDTTKMAFNKKELRVPAGSRVHLTLQNNGQEIDMQHNIVVTESGKYEVIGKAGGKIGASGNYVPNDPMVLAASPISKPGQTVSFEFDAPPPGEYDFVCTYPGHYKKMHGKLYVE